MGAIELLGSFGPKCVSAVIEISCAPNSKKRQALYNTEALVNALEWGGYCPQDIYSGIYYYNGGNYRSNATHSREIDFWIKQLRLDDDLLESIFGEFSALSKKRNDKNVFQFIERVNLGKYEFTSKYVEQLLAYGGEKQSLSNVRGLIFEIVGRRTLAEAVEDCGEVLEISIEPPKIVIDGRTTYQMDAARQIDSVVCCPDKENFSRFMDNLKKMDFIELNIHPYSKLC